MIVTPPDAQPVHLTDWPVLTGLLTGQYLEHISLKTAYSLTYMRQRCGTLRLAPIPLSMHATEEDARKAALVHVARGRVFVISKTPVITLPFGRYSVLMTVVSELDWSFFLTPVVAIDGNVLTPEHFKLRAPLITSRLFDELAPALKHRLQLGQLVFGCLALADNRAPWEPWMDNDSWTRWWSEMRQGTLYWYKGTHRQCHTNLPERILARLRQDLSRWDNQKIG